jgi:biotin carboxyl carrier protein
LRIPLKIRGEERTIEISGDDGHRSFLVDGQLLDADVVGIAPGLYSILLDGRSFEAHVREPANGDVVVTIGGEEFSVRIGDPRQWRGAGTLLAAEGRQKITASMPGKIVRILVAAGQSVTAGQGLVVIEAMKMQNEVRAPKSGRLESLLVAEGQAVNGGEVLAIVG